MKKYLALALACAAFVPSALAATPWDGTWSLDTAKSHLTGTSFTYTKSPNGKWHFSDGAAVSFDFAPDGKDYPTIDADDTISVTAEGDHVLVFVNKFKGKVISTIHEELSPGGKSLTDHTTGTRPDGSTIDDTVLMTRITGTSGFMGKWKSTDVSSSAATSYIIASAPDGTLTWDIPDYKNHISGKADGTPLAITGPTAPIGMTITFKKVTDTQMDYWVKLNDKTFGQGKMTLSADGTSLTDTTWSPGKPLEKTTSVYMKQAL
jgi:hypothetical protein